MLASPPPPPRRRLPRQDFFTGLGATLFAAGVVFLFYGLYHEGARNAQIGAALLLVATIICWMCSAAAAPPE
jgi:drug/metabolite transporter (DMT)-like permease